MIKPTLDTLRYTSIHFDPEPGEKLIPFLQFLLLITKHAPQGCARTVIFLEEMFWKKHLFPNHAHAVLALVNKFAGLPLPRRSPSYGVGRELRQKPEQRVHEPCNIPNMQGAAVLLQVDHNLIEVGDCCVY